MMVGVTNEEDGAISRLVIAAYKYRHLLFCHDQRSEPAYNHVLRFSQVAVSSSTTPKPERRYGMAAMVDEQPTSETRVSLILNLN